MTRRSLSSLLEWLSTLESGYGNVSTASSQAMSLIINGPEGSGKSAVLLQAANVLKQRPNSIVLYEGNTTKFTHGYSPYYPLSNGLFEQPEVGSELLQKMIEFNPFAKDMSIEEGVLLGDLVEQAIKNPLNGQKLFLQVINHLRSSEGGPVVYVLMDSVNCLFGATQYKDQQGVALQVKQLPVLSALLGLFTRPTKSIIAMGAMSFSDPLIRKFQLPSTSKSICTMHVPDMTRKEAAAFLQALSTIGYVSPTTAVDRRFVEHKHFMTGGNSRLLFESAMYDDIYN